MAGPIVGGSLTDPNTISTSVSNPRAPAFFGQNTGIGASGLIAGPDAIFNSTVGVFGRSGNAGVFGFSDRFGPEGTGVAGNTNAGTGTGVHGHTSTGIGVRATCDASGLAASLEGKVVITGDLDVKGNYLGNINCAGDIILLNEDLSEDFEIATEQCPESGTVMVLDAQGRLAECQQPYDKRVAGVIAGGGEFRPAIVLGRKASSRTRIPIALIGKVSCRVDASYAPIAAGDLLTTSPTTGHAMRAADAAKAFGAVIGKALRGLAGGTGYIPILIALQ